MGPGDCTAHDKHPARNIDWAAHAPGREMFGNTPQALGGDECAASQSGVRTFATVRQFDFPFELEDVLSNGACLLLLLARSIDIPWWLAWAGMKHDHD